MDTAMVGHGVINEAGKRFRVVDVWVNGESHGRGVGEYGVYVYVEPPVGIEPTTYSLRVNRSTD